LALDTPFDGLAKWEKGKVIRGKETQELTQQGGRQGRRKNIRSLGRVE